MNKGASGVNTILLVVVLLILVGGGIWWYETYGPGAPAPTQQAGLNIQVTGTSAQ